VSPAAGHSKATVDVDWVAAHIDDPAVRLVEVDVSRAAYDNGHVRGAVLWNAYADLRDADYRPVGLAELRRLLSRSGISPEAGVVVYGYGAPLGFWLLKAHGHEDTRMLLGPREQWTDAGHAWTTDVAKAPESAHPPVEASADLLVSREKVREAIDDPSQVLLDVRAEAEYRGEQFWPSGATEDVGRAGHIPGAVNVPIDALHAEGGAFKNPEELRRILDTASVTPDKTVVTYCTIGNRASEAWYALRYRLSYPNAGVYYGSWVDWGKRDDTPIAT
jgi:thiosulfate/3-mercaptopyruvate sulfurtransferase